VIHQFSECTVGGKGTSVAFEAVHPYPSYFPSETSDDPPPGRIVYIMKYETTANGDR
jgi:hypothetical protein